MPFFSFGGKDSKRYHCRVLLLDDTELTQEITSKTKGYELLDKVFSSLNLYERDYFGLRYRDGEDHTQWLDPERSVKKQMDSSPPFTLYFGVKFYAADPTKVREELTRYQFFLQVKKDLLQGRLPCSFNVVAELCAYAVQSELGDYDPTMHTDGYVSEFRFVPNQTEELEMKVSEIHPKLRGQVPSEAEVNFLERVKWLEMYGVDLHPVKGQDGHDYFLGLTPTGIVLFRDRNKIGSFIWPKITKLKFKSYNFILRANHGKNDEEQEFAFTLNTKPLAKSLWKCCAEHHTFFRLEKANDVPASAYNFLFKKGSGFRFSGRTQQELMDQTQRNKRPQPAVRRVQSKRYARRNSADSTGASSYKSDNGPVLYNTPDGRVMRIHGDSGSYYALNTHDETSPPWEQRPGSQSGLYTIGQSAPPSVVSDGAQSKGISPRFPRRLKQSGSAGEAEMPRRKISSYHAGYSSGEESAARRKRSHYYSGYTSASDGESIVAKSKNRPGSEPNLAYRGGSESRDRDSGRYEDYQKQRYYESRESVAVSAYDGRTGPEQRYYSRESGSKSDGEQQTRQRKHQHYHRNRRAGTSDSEMVPPLDIQRPSEGSQRSHRHHHKHRHHHHRPRGPVPNGYDPKNAQVYPPYTNRLVAPL